MLGGSKNIFYSVVGSQFVATGSAKILKIGQKLMFLCPEWILDRDFALSGEIINGITIYRNGPKRTFMDTKTDSLSTETDRNGTKRTFVDTETGVLSTETDRNGHL